MRYDDAKIENSRTKNWNNSGNESLGFESFDRDDVCMFADAVSTIACSNDAWGRTAQGTSSRTEPRSNTATLSWCDAKADSIATLDSSISALGSSASLMGSDIDKLKQQLNILAAKMGVNFDTEVNYKLNLKNHFRGRRLRRSDLQTI